MRVRRTAAALLLLALAGCSGDGDEAAVLPTLTPAPTATVTVAPTATLAATPEDAQLFARRWYAEITRAYAEKDPEILRALSAPGCASCTRFIESVAKARDNGERVEGITYELTTVVAQGVVDGETNVLVIYNAPETRRYDRAGKLILKEPGVRGFEEELTLIRTADSWLVKKAIAP